MKMNKINSEQNYFYFLIIKLTIIKVWNSLNYFVLRKSGSFEITQMLCTYIRETLFSTVNYFKSKQE